MNNGINIFLVAAGTLFVGACTGAAPPAATGAPAHAEAETLSWSVGPCFGFCPVYSVSVTPAGQITFDGQRHTAALGRQVRDGGTSAYRAMRTALDPFRPQTGTAAQTKCEQRASDLSTFHISWSAQDGTVTSLQHDKGCRSPANERLNEVLESLPSQLRIEDLARQTTRPGASRG